MRIYASELDGQLLLLQTDDQTAVLLDNDEIDISEVLFTARLIDPADLFARDEDGEPLFSIM